MNNGVSAVAALGFLDAHPLPLNGHARVFNSMNIAPIERRSFDDPLVP